MNDIFRKKTVSKVIKDAADGYGDGEGHTGLKRSLGVRDLTALGIAAVVGAGIFSTIGKASFDGGPGIILLFLFVAVACGFSALCYAEFASIVPVSGSAYTYSYVAFGEIIAWIIGWDLLMEYAIGNIVVAISWSAYFTSFLDGVGIHMPAFLTMGHMTASNMDTFEAYRAYHLAPQLFGAHIVFDLPAFMIVVLITYITYIGIKESRNSANVMVGIKMAIIFLVIFVGAFWVTPKNWSPFLPNGLGGVLKGISSVFFAYIGFDAISTTAEECKDPQKDLPRGMIYSLIICTILYVVIALVLTGMVSYTKLNVGEPLAFVFQQVHLPWMAGIVAISAVIATASVLLVFQVGQPRIWMSMSRDGLLPPIFSRIHPKYGTPSFSTILTGLVVGIPALFVNMDMMVDLTSIGTLFAFALVSGGVMMLDAMPDRPVSKFKTPYINSKFIFPLLIVAAFVFWIVKYKAVFIEYLGLQKGFDWELVRAVVPHYLFLILLAILAVLAFRKNLSLIPLLGLLACSYLLSESGATNWERFFIWLLVGLVCYFLYGSKHSKLKADAAKQT
ncbi:MAG: amino acid transporter [Bacteroidetes bacterium]|nr:amino acid transporter [Bacteroidota bacterium]